MALAGLAFWVGEMVLRQSCGSARYKDDTRWVIKNIQVLVLFEIRKDPK